MKEYMCHHIFKFIVILIFVVGSFATAGFGQPVVGCYSDLREISEGIIGNGVVRIWYKNGKYGGSFDELSNELGLAFDPTPLTNIHYDKRTRRIKFDIHFNRRSGRDSIAIIRGVNGKVSSSGIKMNWRGHHGSYGQPNPFMKRLKKDCADL